MISDILQSILRPSRRAGATQTTGLNREDHARWDWVSPICILILSICGVFFIYSAQLNSIYSNWDDQIIWIFLGAFVYLVVSFIDYDIYMKYGHWLYILALVLLLGVLLIGVERDGAKRWLDLGLLNYQPSELAKISVMIVVSSILARSEIGKITESLTALVKVALVVLFPMV
ncbi:MAG: FtsW/RodA/SpoVE family cell cycle protein, partial [Opitutales bacterium]|nr:FtsW/RodA/SpoVE family cell cycle protein [Opitutales bacterium]